jgi:hypothetical protein
MDWEVEAVCTAAECPVLLFPSVKAGLDVDWSDDGQKAGALEELVRQVRSLTTWSAREVPEVLTEVARQYAGALKKVQEQDLEEGKDGKVSIREGVAEDRQVSIEDPEMRHGRKSKSKRFNGYKVHVATDMDSELILAAAVTPANRPEEEAAPGLQADLKRQRVKIRELDVDRGYPNSVLARSVEAEGGEVVCKPFPVRNTHAGLFTKLDFDIDCKTGRVTCPAGETERFEPGQVVHFDPDACGACNLRGRCTHAASGKGRTVTLAEDEERQQRFRALMASPEGRQRLRGRVVVEHRLSHFARKQGPRARYRGVRKNLFDARRTGAVVNRETIDRKLLA